MLPALTKISAFIEARGAAFFFALAAVYFSAITVGTGFLCRHPWSDEHHYLDTVRMFVDSFSLTTIKNYVEMHPPLSYMMYALAGIGFGDRIWVYRLVTMACAFATIGMLFMIMRRVSGRSVFALAVVLFFIINPYTAGLSVFVFSDIPGMMFSVLAVLAAMHGRYWLFGLAGAAAILCRQYNAFFPAAIVAWAVLTPGLFSKKTKWLFCISALLSLAPAVVLFLFWGDIAPPRGIERWNPGREEGFHPEYIVTYLTLFAVYALPAVIVAGRNLFSKTRIAVACAVGLVYFIFPVRPSPIAIEQVNVYTIGFLHKLVKFVTGGNAFIEHAFFYVSFVVAVSVLSWCIGVTVSAVRKNSPKREYLLLFGILTCAFLGVMTFSFFIWEKYLVPVMPFLIGWILLAVQETRGLRASHVSADTSPAQGK